MESPTGLGFDGASCLRRLSALKEVPFSSCFHLQGLHSGESLPGESDLIGNWRQRSPSHFPRCQLLVTVGGKAPATSQPLRAQSARKLVQNRFFWLSKWPQHSAPLLPKDWLHAMTGLALASADPLVVFLPFCLHLCSEAPAADETNCVLNG